jgi:hypothetical protein
MRKLLSPLCLLLALASLICGFAMVAQSEPEPSLELHRARVAGQEQYREVLEEDLARRRLSRKLAIGGLFASAVLFTAAAFFTMDPSGRRR